MAPTTIAAMAPLEMLEPLVELGVGLLGVSAVEEGPAMEVLFELVVIESVAVEAVVLLVSD